jgi:protein TonB
VNASKALPRLSTLHDVRGVLRRVAIRLLLLAGATASTLALISCGTKPPPAPAETPVAEAKAAAKGLEPEAEPPRESDARNVDGYKRDAAKRIYFRNTKRLFDGAPPALLKSIVILSIRIDPKGTPLRVALVRGNGNKDLEQRAIQSVHDAAPLPIPRGSLLTKGALEYYETWLFRDDERFQIRSLAEVQQGGD